MKYLLNIDTVYHIKNKDYNRITMLSEELDNCAEENYEKCVNKYNECINHIVDTYPPYLVIDCDHRQN